MSVLSNFYKCKNEGKENFIFIIFKFSTFTGVKQKKAEEFLMTDPNTGKISNGQLVKTNYDLVINCNH